MKKLREYIRRKFLFLTEGYVSYSSSSDRWHRINGPAMEWSNGDYVWCDNGAWHRYYGVSMRWNGYNSYWINGKQIT